MACTLKRTACKQAINYIAHAADELFTNGNNFCWLLIGIAAAQNCSLATLLNALYAQWKEQSASCYIFQVLLLIRRTCNNDSVTPQTVLISCSASSTPAVAQQVLPVHMHVGHIPG
jgi:hypothetical protein